MRTSLAQVCLTLIVSTTAMAQKAAVAESKPDTAVTRDGARGAIFVAPKVGISKSTSALSAALFLGAEVGYALPVLEQKLVLNLEFSWHAPTLLGAAEDPRLTVGGQTASGDNQLTVSQWSFLLGPTYRASGLVEKLTPYGGAGLLMIIHAARMIAFGSENYESATRFGFGLLLGGEYELGPGGAFVELQYRFAPVDLLTTGNANVGGFFATLGYRFRF